MEEVDRLIAALRTASYKDREPLKQKLLELARGPAGATVRDHIESARRGGWGMHPIVNRVATFYKDR